MTSWQLQDAKNKLSELIDRAQKEGPQVITRHGVEVAVVMPYAGYKKLTAPRQRLGDFLLASPLRKSGLVIARDQRTALRTIDL
ncbi:MAG: type II toxin-antitoxin system Phd/YefM family antitoxin [Anaerolineales bacterium]|nr:type II toxin-antitoxin system Phd/YefM family antitoxin [Anaerolineales bacterium]